VVIVLSATTNTEYNSEDTDMSDIINNENKNKYWQDVENKVLDPKDLAKEFKDDEFDSFSVTKSRRNFLKIMGFTVSTMPLAGCIKIPVRKAIPYLNKVENQYPGVANYYASTFNNTPVVIKTREGRPIYVKGNKLSQNTKGGINAPAIASVLSLYDSNRLRAPQVNGNDVEWDVFDKTFKKMFGKSIESGKDVYIVTPSVKSPSQIALLDRMNSKFGVKHIAYDAFSNCAAHQANYLSNKVNEPNETDFSKADMIVSFGADFLGSWGDDVKNTKEYTSRRNPDENMSKHVQVESIMTLTGTNADIRHTRSVISQRQIIKAMLETLEGDKVSVEGEDKDFALALLKELKSSAASLVISGDSLISTQVMINKINYNLGNYGKTVNLVESKFAKYSNNIELDKAFENAGAGNVAGMMFWGVNPAHTFYNQTKAINAIKGLDFSVSFASSSNETSSLCQYIAPANHVFESWNDNYNGYNEVSLTQPVIQPLFGSRMVEESLMALLDLKGSYYEFIRDFWESNFYPLASVKGNFETFWNKTLHDGVVTLSGLSKEVKLNISNLKRDTSEAMKIANAREADDNQLNLVMYQKYGVREGSQANNPWIQELPDPVTKATWDNYIMIAKKRADKDGIKSGDVLELKTETGSIKLPAIVQPGVATNTVGVAVGYGRKIAGKVATGLGENVYQLGRLIEGTHSYHDTKVISLKKTGAHKGLAQTQTHHSMEGRDIVREATLDAYKKDGSAGNKEPMKLAQIYPGHVQGGHQWAMAIDMNTCTGCSSCIISCSSENNVPVVGRAEVKNRREMHWLRIDRYYAGDEQEPETVHMPMMCQHCENAPCENVCPVLATVHSSDGLNQQIYNRCVGTRYCANNCPYKVRRFNWFNYDRSDEYERLALNPDISVRSRGVMEKCSFCVQRIQEGKLNAKRERRELRDGDIKTACQEGCPSDAIVFGDMKDENSKIAKMIEHNRRYTVLEELNVKSRVSYMVKVRNK